MDIGSLSVIRRAPVTSGLFVYREHPWFNIDLPDYLFPPPGADDPKSIDEAVVAEVCAVRAGCIVLSSQSIGLTGWFDSCTDISCTRE